MRANTWKVFTMMVVLCISRSSEEIYGCKNMSATEFQKSIRKIECLPIKQEGQKRFVEMTKEERDSFRNKILTKYKYRQSLKDAEIDWLFDAKNDGYFTKMEFVFIDSIINQSEYGRHKLKMQTPEFSLKGIVSLPLSLREQAKIIRSLQENGQ